MKYTMTAEEYGRLMKAAQTPGVFTGGVLAGHDPAREASMVVWRELGERYGFQWETVKPGGSPREFMAEPKPMEPFGPGIAGGPAGGLSPAEASTPPRVETAARVEKAVDGLLEEAHATGSPLSVALACEVTRLRDLLKGVTP